MDDSCGSSPGQQKVSISKELVEQIAHQCDILQRHRAWYEHYESEVRTRGPALVKGHDLFVDGAISARQVARELGIVLPDISDLTWELSPRLARTSGPI